MGVRKGTGGHGATALGVAGDRAVIDPRDFNLFADGGGGEKFFRLLFTIRLLCWATSFVFWNAAPPLRR